MITSLLSSSLAFKNQIHCKKYSILSVRQPMSSISLQHILQKIHTYILINMYSFDINHHGGYFKIIAVSQLVICIYKFCNILRYINFEVMLFFLNTSNHKAIGLAPFNLTSSNAYKHKPNPLFLQVFIVIPPLLLIR